MLTGNAAGEGGMMSVTKIRNEVSKALWALRQGSTPDHIARNDAEMALDKLLRQIDDEAQTERDAKPFAIVDNNGGVEA